MFPNPLIQVVGRARSCSARTEQDREPSLLDGGSRYLLHRPGALEVRLHLPVVVRALPVRSCVDSFVGQCDLPRRRPVNLSLMICTTVASAANLQVVVYYKSRKRELKAKLMNESVR